MRNPPNDSSDVTGAFVSLNGERYYLIGNVDKLAPFFISLVSDGDHWLFIASNGGLTAGRVSPATALFPYVTVDKIYDSPLNTGSKTLLRAQAHGKSSLWEPFNLEHAGRYAVTRNLYKSALGNKLLFEEINHDLQLAFRYEWLTSDKYGFVRRSELENRGESICGVDVIDGIQNILPAGTPRLTQNNSSYLVDAYKRNELDEETGLAFFTLYSSITDRAEPSESLKATTVFCLDLDDYQVLLSANQLDGFRDGRVIEPESRIRGVRGAYLVKTSLELEPESSRSWQLVADIEQSQADSVDLQRQLRDRATLGKALARSIDLGSDTLARIMAAADGSQLTAEENVSTHHYANVLFNVLRGGIFDDQYRIAASHFAHHVCLFNNAVYQRHRPFLEALPEESNLDELRAAVMQQDDLQLERLCYEYLPITFGRRHGDPSRPWNEFAIRLQDEHGQKLLTYQGNWRDIFQNWEALLLSYPGFVGNVIAKFVNASTADGYNPYRITNEGIDWEVEEPDDPWSYIGYWGDHQIIYLLKLLELSQQFHPERLGELLQRPIFSYANVPYKIKPLAALLEDAKSTVLYDHEQAERIEQRVARLGADGKLLPNTEGGVCHVNLLEKLLVPLLCKLCNLVVDGGIWLNTQRPEWNDANNALVGQGLSMVTLYYMRRYIQFLQRILTGQPDQVKLSREVSEWLLETTGALNSVFAQPDHKQFEAKDRHRLLLELGQAAEHYRTQVYAQESLSAPVVQDLQSVVELLDVALMAIDHSISANRRDDGLYQAYNLLEVGQDEVHIDSLYPMLEGQVAALSAGAIPPSQAVEVLERLFDSEMFREDQNSFLLYPDRRLPGFLQKNCVSEEEAIAIPLLQTMLERDDRRLIERDAGGTYRFSAGLHNSGDLDARLDALAADYGDTPDEARETLRELYERTFNHKAFTGRSGGMFGFEGLGSIYWHMVSKLLLAVQENFFSAMDQKADASTCQQLGRLYYRVRSGIGFNKTPAEYGAFPTDPYSHTPRHLGAQQPGMTGQVKEEILARFGELGIRVREGAVQFQPGLLRTCELTNAPQSFRYVDVQGGWQELSVPASGLAFTWCQVPLVYQLDEAANPEVSVLWDDGKHQVLSELALPQGIAAEIFQRTGRVRQIRLSLNARLLFNG
jgi:hypothetical protein